MSSNKNVNRHWEVFCSCYIGAILRTTLWRFSQSFRCNDFWVGCHTFCGIVSLVYSNQSVCNLKHVVSQGDDDKLCIFCLLLKNKLFALAHRISESYMFLYGVCVQVLGAVELLGDNYADQSQDR